MPNSMEPDLERRIDLYVRGELSPAEARELAQAALRRPDLFEELNAAALAKAAIETAPYEILERYVSGQLSPMGQRELAREALNNDQLFDALATHGTVERGLEDAAFRDAVLRKPRSKVRIFAMVGSIAAAVAFFTVYLKSPAPKLKTTPITASVSRGTLKPTLDPSMGAGQPILLASQLRPPAGQTRDTTIFRGSEPESRAPQQQGSILSIEEKLPTIDLGSLDGLAKGNEVRVYRDGKAVGRIAVTTVFRDRARGRIAAGETIRVGDRVRTDSSVYSSAVLQQVNALAASGDLKKAIDAAQKALIQVGTNRKLLERLATLEYQTGALDAALQHYEAAAPQEIGALNSLTALYLLRGEYQRAEALLSGKTNEESLNNSGVAAELRGDSIRAAQYYEEALRLSETAPIETRKSIQANLTRVKSLK
jgi:tetratricopeptide (TPR) repeat protein